MTKYYLHCPDCRTRMKRTGNKEIEHYSVDRPPRPIYRREMECPGCGRVREYSESKNMWY
jgi:uncharacterized protein with PIN domain